MAMIVLMPFHWASDMNPSFALARKLRDRGHRVHYLGHSMGALIAFELARHMRRDYSAQPVHLFVSGRPSPQTVSEPRAIRL